MAPHKPDLPRLQGERVTLRPPMVRDKDDRLACGRDPDIVRMYGVEAASLPPFTHEDVEAWYRAARASVSWMIEAGSRCIGTAGLHQLGEQNHRARYAIGIFDPAALGRGLGTEATRLVLRYAFETLRLHRVGLRVLAFNRRAIACYEKCGFVREGIERDTVLVDGEWASDVIMSILEGEYRAVARQW